MNKQFCSLRDKNGQALLSIIRIMRDISYRGSCCGLATVSQIRLAVPRLALTTTQFALGSDHLAKGIRGRGGI